SPAMSTIATLFWLEARRSAWVLYGALVGLVLFALVLLALPPVVTGLDVVGIPTESEEDGGGAFEMHRESDATGESRSFRFSRSWGGGDADEEPAAQPPSTPPKHEDEDAILDLELPDELQLAFRPRQAATAIAAMFLAAAVLLGFFVSHLREADRGEMVILYQSPVSPETQLAARFLFMSGAACLVFASVLGIYWFVQASQSLSPTTPIVEGFGASASVHWRALVLASAITQILPASAFILLFVQMQNAYDLLGGQRLVGMVLLLAGLVASVFTYDRLVTAAPEGARVISVVRVEAQPMLDALVTNFDPARYRYDMPLTFIAAAAAITALMLALSARVFREVEWS
ncbi:MAG: hypothetical protein GY944_25205, partial [bacterium]|nr:hypothetical protein [bacterium]